MSKIDRDSRSPVRANEDKGSPMKNSNSSAGSSAKKRRMNANYLVVKRKLKDLAEEFLNAKI
jgi:hypothetical protein